MKAAKIKILLVSVIVLVFTGEWLLYCLRHYEVASNSVATSTKEPAGGYVLTLRYMGQQIAGIRGMSSQQCWLNSFKLPMKMVEPFIMDSIVGHSVEIWKNSASSFRFTSLYRPVGTGRTGFNMATWDEFMKSAPRELIVLDIRNPHLEGNCLNYKNSPCTKDKSPSLETDCEHSIDIRNSSKYLVLQGFKVVRNICLDCFKMRTTTPDGLMEHIFENYRPENVTLLVSHWKFSFWMTPNCSSHAECPGSEEALKDIQPSLKMEENARNYMEMMDQKFNVTQPGERKTIGVMVRVEWLLMEFGDNGTRICLQQVTEEVSALREGLSETVLTLDVGRFGSGTFDLTFRIRNMSPMSLSDVMPEIESFVEVLYDETLSFKEWEESFPAATGGVTDRGYIAALQSLIVSKADCLVLVGGGFFQELALERYVNSNPGEKCVHFLCVPNTFLVRANNVMKSSY